MKNKTVTCHDIKGNEYSVSIDKLTFRPSVYGVVIEDGKVLLSKQWDGYDFPGGAIELGETIEEALIREFKEETGIDIKTGRLLLCENSFFKITPKEEHVQSILIYYLCEKVGGDLSIEFLDEDEKEYLEFPEWVDLNNVRNIKFYNSIDSVKLLESLGK